LGRAEPILLAEGLSRRFGTRRALDGVDLRVDRGESVAVFGANGAGKTTLLRLLSSGLLPTSGSVRFEGRRVRGGDAALRARIGLLSHQTFLYDDLSAEENLLFFGRLHGLEDPEGRSEALLREVGLRARAEDRVRTFSRGMQQRLALARALLHEPALLFLDEPFSGLDPTAAESIRGTLQRFLGRGGTIVLTTHDVDLGLALCVRWIFLAAGRVADAGTTRPSDRERLLAAYGRPGS
jgi:heme exporter protein A